MLMFIYINDWMNILFFKFHWRQMTTGVRWILTCSRTLTRWMETRWRLASGPSSSPRRISCCSEAPSTCASIGAKAWVQFFFSFASTLRHSIEPCYCLIPRSLSLFDGRQLLWRNGHISNRWNAATTRWRSGARSVPPRYWTAETGSLKCRWAPWSSSTRSPPFRKVRSATVPTERDVVHIKQKSNDDDAKHNFPYYTICLSLLIAYIQNTHTVSY